MKFHHKYLKSPGNWHKTASAPAPIRLLGNSGLQWLAPAKPMAFIPAALAASTPTTVSSTTKHRDGGALILDAANRKRSGAGLPLRTSAALNTFGDALSHRPTVLSAI